MAVVRGCMDSMTCKLPFKSLYGWHGGMSRACACRFKAMGAMPWLNYLGKSSNEALLRAGHGLGAGHVINASLTWEGLVASISYWWCMTHTTRHVDVLQGLGKKGVSKRYNNMIEGLIDIHGGNTRLK